MVGKVKIFLAGTFGEKKHFEEVKRCLYLLESFYYIKDWQIELIKGTKDFLLDSGAFTFAASKKTEDWDRYLERYADFINTYDIKHFFELDIDSIVGYDKVKEFRTP